MDWFLYDNGSRHERVNELLIKEQPRTEVAHFRNNNFKLKMKNRLSIIRCVKKKPNMKANNHDYILIELY